jgi:dCMP deaminase
MPAGWDNACEYKNYNSIHDSNYFELKTKPEVLHAESNAIAKLAKSNESGAGASLFVTHAPCIDCAKLIHQGGITEVYYLNDYRSSDGIEFLLKCGLQVQKVVE